MLLLSLSGFGPQSGHPLVTTSLRLAATPSHLLIISLAEVGPRQNAGQRFNANAPASAILGRRDVIPPPIPRRNRLVPEPAYGLASTVRTEKGVFGLEDIKSFFWR
jgi:hypothetical protein